MIFLPLCQISCDFVTYSYSKMLAHGHKKASGQDVLSAHGFYLEGVKDL